VASRVFTLDEAQALLEDRVRALAERLVATRARARPLEERWRALVVKIGSNGGNLSKQEAEGLRTRLEGLTGEARALLADLDRLGVQVKDPDTGLLDFPAVVDGEDGLLCWRVGEERIAFWHRPQDGFAGRRPLAS
jgi:hypothetical protein